MKTRIFLLLLPLVIGLNGCLVKSLHPFYTEKDIVFKPEIIGSWTDQDSAAWLIRRHMKSPGLFKPEIPDNGYEITFTDNKGSSRFVARLFQLEGQSYLDFYPLEIQSGNELGNFHLIPSHSLARISFNGNSIIVRWYNEEWLMNLFNENRVRIAHERIPYDVDDTDRDHDQVILTAPTVELQKFIRKYGNDPDAFRKGSNGNDFTFVLTKNRDL